MQWSKSAFHELPSSTYLGESFPRKSKDTEFTEQIFSWSFPTNFTSMIQAVDTSWVLTNFIL